MMVHLLFDDSAPFNWLSLKQGTGNGEWGTGNVGIGQSRFNKVGLS